MGHGIRASTFVVLLGGSLVAAATERAMAQGGPAPRVTRGPYLQALLDTSVEIRFSLDDDAAARVRVHDGVGAVREVAGEEAIDQRVVVDGLAPDTAYRYEIVVDGEVAAGGANLRFRTAPRSGEGTLRAVAIGDSGVGTSSQLFIAEELERVDADLFLHTGDLIYRGLVDEVIFAPYARVMSRSCLSAARGNHDDLLDLQGLSWHELFAAPGAVTPEAVDYAFDWGPVHLVFLDYSRRVESPNAQIAFLEGDLADARSRGVPWLVVVTHVPPFTVGAHWDWDDPLRLWLPEVCDRFGVDLVLSGHDHNYQRFHPVHGRRTRDAWQDPLALVRPRGTVWVVTGGGGGLLYPRTPDAPDEPLLAVFRQALHWVELEASPTRLTLVARTFGGVELDALELRKDGDRPPFRLLRGDVDIDGDIDLGDPVGTLRYLFLGEDIPCPAAAAVRSGRTEPLITDAIYLLRWLFDGGPPPRAPFPECGEASLDDDLGCRATGC